MRFRWLSVLLFGLLMPNPTLAEPALSLLIEKTAPAHLREWIAEGLRESQVFVNTTFKGLNVSQKITVHASSDPKWLTDRYLEARDFPESHRPGKLESFGACDPPAEFGGYSIFLCLRSNIYGEGEVTVKSVLAHEHWHVVQTDLVGEKALPCCSNNHVMSVYGPEWLKEGSAQFISFMTLDALLLTDADRAFTLFAQLIPEGDLQLSKRSTRAGFHELDTGISELIGILGSNLLVKQSGYGSLVDFYRLLGDDVESNDAFRMAFGRTPAQFEDELELYIAELRPDPT